MKDFVTISIVLILGLITRLITNKYERVSITDSKIQRDVIDTVFVIQKVF